MANLNFYPFFGWFPIEKRAFPTRFWGFRGSGVRIAGEAVAVAAEAGWT